MAGRGRAGIYPSDRAVLAKWATASSILQLESQRQIACDIVCSVRRRVLPTRLSKLNFVAHDRCSSYK
jgi:hypothetical protein